MVSDLNLGTLNGPVLLFGGPYSNAQATEALLNQAKALHIPSPNIICTGDIVAYAGDPAQTTDIIMQSGMHVVMGNCEESFGFEGDDCGCGFDEGSACDVLSRQWYAHASSQLKPNHRNWMRNLPRLIRLTLGGFQLAVIHGGLADISRWIFKSTPASEKHEEINFLAKSGPVDIVIGGHCGLPFADDLGDTLWLNAGVIGMPANDGTPRTWFTVLTPTQNGLKIEFHALSYDHQSASSRMRQLGLAGAYAQTLQNGLWPNMDVLPKPERQLIGHPITPWSVEWGKSIPAAAE